MAKKKINKFEGVTINESEYNLLNGKKGKIAVLLYSGGADPKIVLDCAISEYVKKSKYYYELIESSLDNPWMRVILSDINNMEQEKFGKQKLLKRIKRSINIKSEIK